MWSPDLLLTFMQKYKVQVGRLEPAREPFIDSRLLERVDRIRALPYDSLYC